LCITFIYVDCQQTCEARIDNKKGQSVPSAQDIAGFRQCLQKGANALFNANTGLPLQSSPVCTTLLSYIYLRHYTFCSNSVNFSNHFIVQYCLQFAQLEFYDRCPVVIYNPLTAFLVRLNISFCC